MKNTLRVLLQILFQERSDAKIVTTLSAASFRQSTPTRQHETLSLLPFSDARVRACVHEVKFHKNNNAVDILADVLRTHLEKEKPKLIIPIPLSDKRLNERGYNQVTLIAKRALEHTVHTVDEEVLCRVVDTAPQTTLSRAQRIQNMQNAFAVYDFKTTHEKIAGRDIIVLDDVTTTGATLSAAKAALLQHSPASVTLLALAH